MKVLTLFLILLPCLSTGEILRLSKVVSGAGKGVTKYEYGDGDAKQVIFVEDKAIVTDEDVKIATASLTREHAVDISLTDDGGGKMIAATTPMRPGTDRIAILVRGKVKTAPTLKSVPLGRNFSIDGLDEPNEAEILVGLISGKSIEQLRKEKADAVERMKKIPPPPEPVYHTNEEYSELSKARGKLGLNYMDRLYTEEEIKKLVSPGMTRADVEAIFGKPNKVSAVEDGIIKISFQTAPEKLPMEKVRFMRMISFVVEMKDGKVISSRPEMWSGRTRESKSTPIKLDNIIIKSPPVDMSSEDFNFIVFLENHKISLKEGKDTPTKADKFQILNLIWALASNCLEGESIDSQCNVITFLIPSISELADLTKKSKAGKISTCSLKTAIEPYVFGKKQLH